MKFQPDRAEGVNLISRQEPHCLWVNAQAHTRSVLVPWQGAAETWPVDAIEQLAVQHFELVLALKPELVIFGSGTRLQFIKPALYLPLIERRIGFETMDTAAACRTYNVLASEGRAVVAALLVSGGFSGGLPGGLPG